MQTAKKISEYLAANGISPTFVASKANIERQRFYALIRGERKMDADEFLRICKVLGKDPNFFMDVEEEGV